MRIFTFTDNKQTFLNKHEIFKVKFLKSKNTLLQLKEAIVSSLEKNEDFFLFTDSLENLEKHSNINLYSQIKNLASENINVIFYQVECEKRIPINPVLYYLEGILKVKAFFLCKPIYKIVLSLIEYKEDYNCKTIEDLLKIIDINSLGLSPLKINDVILKHNIKVISPFRNVENFINDYLGSIKCQTYDKFSVQLIDDCSTDNYENIISLNSKFKLRKNETRKYALLNILNALRLNNYEEEDIICLIDPDDVLVHRYVFEIINAIYSSDEELLITYGSMKVLREEMVIGKIGSSYTEHEFSNLRKNPWKASHIRTFKYKVFKKLLKIDSNFESMRDEFNNILKMPYDMALMFPLMEIAGFKKVKYLNTLLYGYRQHKDNDHNESRDLQYQGELLVRQKPSFSI